MIDISTMFPAVCSITIIVKLFSKTALTCKTRQGKQGVAGVYLWSSLKAAAASSSNSRSRGWEGSRLGWRRQLCFLQLQLLENSWRQYWHWRLELGCTASSTLTTSSLPVTFTIVTVSPPAVTLATLSPLAGTRPPHTFENVSCFTLAAFLLKAAPQTLQTRSGSGSLPPAAAAATAGRDSSCSSSPPWSSCCPPPRARTPAPMPRGKSLSESCPKNILS